MKVATLVRGGSAAALLLALALGLPGAAQAADLEVKIDNFTFGPQKLSVKQVSQNANRLRLFARHLAHHRNQLSLLLVRSMRKIQPRYIKPRAQQLAKRLFCTRCRP